MDKADLLVHGKMVAEQLWQDVPPPFVHKEPAGLRKKVIIAARQEESCPESEVVNRRWRGRNGVLDESHTFTTIDLAGRRFIVQALESQSLPGSRYHIWWPSKQLDLDLLPVAFSWPRELAEQLASLREVYVPGSFSYGYDNMKHRLLVLGTSSSPSRKDKTETRPTGSSSVNDQWSNHEVWHHRQQSLNMNAPNLAPSRNNSGVHSPPMTGTHGNEDLTKRPVSSTSNQPRYGVSEPKDLSVSGPTLVEGSEVSAVMTKSRGNGRGDQRPFVQDQPVDWQTIRTGAYIPALVPGHKRRRQSHDSIGEGEHPEQVVDASQIPTTFSPQPSTSSILSRDDSANRNSTATRQTTPSATSNSPIASYKQSRTALRIMLPFSSDYVPLKLRSCITMSSLFVSALAVSGQGSLGTEVSGLRATFDWKDERDVERAMLLKQDYPDTFEVFLEIIDQAPCWMRDDSRCSVAIEVVLE